MESQRFTIQQIHNETDLYRTTLTQIRNNKIKRIDLDTLDRLLIFFNKYFPCTLSDLIEFTND